MLFGQKTNTVLAAIITAHLFICIIFSFFVYPILEEKFQLDITQDEYDDLAWSMAQGKGFKALHGEESVIRGPGYPAMLATIYIVAGHNFQAVQFVQCLLSVLVILMTWLIGKQLFSEKTALLATAIMCFNPLLLWYVPRVMVEVPFTLACLLVFYFSQRLLERNSNWLDLLFISLSIAAAAYIKSIALIFPVVVFLLLLIYRKGLLDCLIKAGIILVIVVLLILPWTLRNHAVTGELVPVHTSLALPIVQGILYVDNFVESPFSTRRAMLQTKETMRHFSEAGGGRAIAYPLKGLKDELEVDKSVKNYIISHYKKEPFDLIKGMAIRSVLFWYYSSNKLFSVFLLVLNVALLSLAAFGLFKLKDNKYRWIPLVWTLFFVGFHSLIIASARFTLQLHPLLLFLACGFFSNFWKRQNSKKTAFATRNIYSFRQA